MSTIQDTSITCIQEKLPSLLRVSPITLSSILHNKYILSNKYRSFTHVKMKKMCLLIYYFLYLGYPVHPFDLQMAKQYFPRLVKSLSSDLTLADYLLSQIFKEVSHVG